MVPAGASQLRADARGVPGQESSLIPDRFNPRFFSFFAWYVRRMLRGAFHAVRLERGSMPALESVIRQDSPVIMLLSHASWWDPLIGVFMHDRMLRSRSVVGPIDAEQLKRFRFMRKLGLFGVDPSDPGSLAPMVDHILNRFAEDARATLWITPQGRFADPREPIEVRPGAAAVAARAGDVSALCLAVEYAFWNDKRPEVFIRAARVEPPDGRSLLTTTDWHRAIQTSMQANADALAAAVIARSPDRFESLLGGDSASIHPVYDLLLALRGVRGGIAERRSRQERQS